MAKVSSTNKHLSALLPKVLGQINALHQDRPDLIIAAWPEVIGPRLSSMTEAVSFQQGILAVKVGNSTLYSVLVSQERARLLKLLQKKFPTVQIKNIHFKIG